MKILVTGGTGMLGHAIVHQYAKQHQIRFLGRDTKKGELIAQSTGSEFIAADLSDMTALARACEGVDGVIHCAALSSPWGRYNDFFQANVVGTQAILHAAEYAQVSKFVHISTPSLYFQYQDERMISESKSLGPKFCNHYAHTKALAECQVQKSALDHTIIRPRGLFGAYDSAIIPRLMQAVRGNTLWVPSARNPTVDLTYVNNVADAAMLALMSDHACGETYNITNDQPLPLLDVIQSLFQALDKPVQIRTLPYAITAPLVSASETLHKMLPSYPEPTITQYSAALFHYHQTLDVRKAKTQLGYRPKISIEEGIQRYARWYKSQSI